MRFSHTFYFSECLQYSISFPRTGQCEFNDLCGWIFFDFDNPISPRYCLIKTQDPKFDTMSIVICFYSIIFSHGLNSASKT